MTEDTGVRRGRDGGRPTPALMAGVCTAALAGALILAPSSGWAAPAPATAPQAPKPKTPAAPQAADHETELSQVVVSASGARPQPGAVAGDIKPELQLSPADIQSYGVSTVSELLDELAPQTQSDRGRGGEAPVVLLNGRPISGMNEIRNIPTEAILRVDILPEEVALKYGYSANQRVVNVVMRRFFRSVTGEGGVSGPTEGGQVSGEAEVDQFTVRGEDRLNLDLKYSASSALNENERDLTPITAGQPYDLRGNVTATTPNGAIPSLSALAGRPVTIAGVPAAGATRPLGLSDFASTAGVQNTSDVGQYRTLSPASRSVSANGVLSRTIFGGVSATVNATLGATTSRYLQGLPGVVLTVPGNDPFSPLGSPVVVNRYIDAFGALKQDTDGWTAHLGTSLNRDLGKWRLSLTGNYDHADSLVHGDLGLDPSAIQAQLNAASPGLNPFGPLPGPLFARLSQDKAHSVSDSANVRLLASGPLFKVPAGQVTTSVRISDAVSGFSTRAQHLGAVQAIDLSRNTFNGQVSIDVPVTSRKNHVLGFIGDLTVNANTALDHVSGFGNLDVLGYGLNWTPVTGLSLIVSHTRDQTAPSWVNQAV